MGETILLAHGSGGKLSHNLIEKIFLPLFDNAILNQLDDSATFELNGQLAFTTDSYVVNPIFFPGGDIGKLAIYGTVNDLAMKGAAPLFLSISLIIEEGLSLEELKLVANSMKIAAQEANVKIVTGDTKVVNRGNADKLFITSSGLGVIPPGTNISGANARPGDKIIVSGTIGEHGIAVMSQREGLKFSVPVKSDCAPLHKLVAEMLKISSQIHCLRDPTRGGLATTLNEFARQSSVGIEIEEEKIPISDAVRAACELLGFDPLYIANEGKLVAIVAPQEVEQVLSKIKQNQYGADASIIGTVIMEPKGKVLMKTRFGASRIIDMLTGELLPRIC